MKQKKAWLRVVEAFIAILLIGTVILYIYPQIQQNSESDQDIYTLQRNILDFITNDKDLRAAAVRSDTAVLNDFILQNLPSHFGYRINICKVNEICNDGIPIDKDVYATEALVSATATDFPDQSTKKIRFFVWRK